MGRRSQSRKAKEKKNKKVKRNQSTKRKKRRKRLCIASRSRSARLKKTSIRPARVGCVQDLLVLLHQIKVYQQNQRVITRPAIHIQRPIILTFYIPEATLCLSFSKITSVGSIPTT